MRELAELIEQATRHVEDGRKIIQGASKPFLQVRSVKLPIQSGLPDMQVRQWCHIPNCG
jgi:hypothetical protein